MNSPTTSSPSSPLYLLVGWRTKSLTSSPTSSLSSSISSTWSTSSSATGGASTTQSSMTCAFPSWPSRPCLSPTLSAQSTSSGSTSSSANMKWQVPSSYISDFDLYPDELDDDEIPYLDEAPAPPREYLPIAAPLPPLYASERPKNKRRRSSKKGVKFAKPMTPIAEYPTALE